jgi:multidrug resistance efflux pump
MALGMFYRPTDRVMFSLGGTMGNGENMINAGISFALDKGVTTGKAAMAKKIAAQDEKIAMLEGENAEQKAEIRELKAALARIEAKLGK